MLAENKQEEEQSHEADQQQQSAYDQGGQAVSAAEFTVEDQPHSSSFGQNVFDVNQVSHVNDGSYAANSFVSEERFETINDDQSEEAEPLVESCESDGQLSYTDHN